MNPRFQIRLLGLLAAGAVVVTACGGGGATSAPTGGVTAPPATAAAPSSPAQSTDEPTFSFALPSGFNADTELEALLPAQLGGQDVFKLSMTGDQFVGAGEQGSDELSNALSQLGKTPQDLSVAFGGTDAVSVFAYRIKGVDATTFFNAFLQTGMSQGATITDVTIAGKSVRKVVTAESETIYLYTSGQVLFGVGGDDVPDALLNEVFSKLP
ncbi:MAG TPA: hypothetical protein VNL94_10230 [Candidatus Binatia bacterium]|nr:hypothetical protein [Candidatus Binatia bacterium]